MNCNPNIMLAFHSKTTLNVHKQVEAWSSMTQKTISTKIANSEAKTYWTRVHSTLILATVILALEVTGN